MNAHAKASIPAIVTLVLSISTMAHVFAEEQTTYSILQKAVSSEVSYAFLKGDAQQDVVDFPAEGGRRIVIIDAHGNKIREERIPADQSFCNSTLVPMIYKCSFVAETYGVCYYLLRKH